MNPITQKEKEETIRGVCRKTLSNLSAFTQKSTGIMGYQRLEFMSVFVSRWRVRFVMMSLTFGPEIAIQLTFRGVN